MTEHLTIDSLRAAIKQTVHQDDAKQSKPFGQQNLRKLLHAVFTGN